MRLRPRVRAEPLQASPVVIAFGIAAAALAYDPGAAAADCKRVAILLVAIGLLLASRGAGWTTGVGEVPPAPGNLSPPAFLWCAFLLWSGISLAWGGALGWHDLGLWGGATGILIAVQRLPPARARQVARLTAVLVGGLSSLVALAEWRNGARGVWIHAGHGNADWLGLTLAMCLPLSIDWAGRRYRAARPGSVARAVAFAAIALPIAGLWLARSRTAWLAALGGVTAGATLVLARRRGGLGRALFWRASLSGVLGAVAAHEHALPAIQRSLEGRAWIWRASSVAAAAALPWGAGLGRFSAVYLGAQGAALASYAPAAAARLFVNATTAHNDWLQVLVESGAPGLLLLGATIAAGIRRSWRAESFSGLATFVTLGLAALGDCPLRQPAVVVILALAIAALPAHAPAAGDAPLRLSRAFAGAPRITAAVVPCAALPRARAVGLPTGIYLGLAPPLLAIALSTWLGARTAAAARDRPPDEGVALLTRAAAIDPRSGEIALERGIALVAIGRADAALDDFERARRFAPGVGVEIATGNAFVLLDDPRQAVAAYARALRFAPGSFRAHANLASALAMLGRRDESAAELQIARSLFPGHLALAGIADSLRRAPDDAW